MTFRPLVLLAVALLSVSVLGGCRNDCQKLCAEMADYWTECQVSYGDAEVAECRQIFSSGEGETESSPSNEDKYQAACRQLIATEENADGERMIALRARFTCDDMKDGPGGAFGGANN